MERVGAYEAKTHLSRLLQQVEQGSTIAITRHGQEIAHLVPAPPGAADPVRTIAELRQARRGITLSGDTVRDLIDEGRR